MGKYLGLLVNDERELPV